jgi:hypothetical protein
VLKLLKTNSMEQEKIETIQLMDIPFSISFTWKDETIRVELENGEDVLKFATIFSNMLTANNIPHKIIK